VQQEREEETKMENDLLEVELAEKSGKEETGTIRIWWVRLPLLPRDPSTMDLLQPAAHLVGMDSEETDQGGKIDLAREERVERGPNLVPLWQWRSVRQRRSSRVQETRSLSIRVFLYLFHNLPVAKLGIFAFRYFSLTLVFT
jgi:hypothetical protein